MRKIISVYPPGMQTDFLETQFRFTCLVIRRVNFSLPRLLENDNFGLPRNVRRISVYFGEKDPFSLPCWEAMISVYGVELKIISRRNLGLSTRKRKFRFTISE